MREKMRDKILSLVALMVSVIVLVVSFFYLVYRANNGLPCGMIAAQLFACALIVVLCTGNVYKTFHTESDED